MKSAFCIDFFMKTRLLWLQSDTRTHLEPAICTAFCPQNAPPADPRFTLNSAIRNLMAFCGQFEIPSPFLKSVIISAICSRAALYPGIVEAAICNLHSAGPIPPPDSAFAFCAFCTEISTTSKYAKLLTAQGCLPPVHPHHMHITFCNLDYAICKLQTAICNLRRLSKTFIGTRPAICNLQSAI